MCHGHGVGECKTIPICDDGPVRESANPNVGGNLPMDVVN